MRLRGREERIGWKSGRGEENGSGKVKEDEHKGEVNESFMSELFAWLAWHSGTAFWRLAGEHMRAARRCRNRSRKKLSFFELHISYQSIYS